MYRHALAFLAAPLAAIACFWAAFAFEAWRGAGSCAQADYGNLWSVLLLFGLPAYAVALLLGLPTMVLFRALGVRSFVAHCAATLLMGLAVGIHVGFGWDFTVLCCVAGVLSGCLYWLLAFRFLAAVESSEAELYGS